MRTFAEKPVATKQTAFAESTNPARSNFEQSRKENSLLHLQRTLRNQAVQRLLQSEKDLEASSGWSASTEFGHDFSRIPLYAGARRNKQPRLKVNALGDIYEQEAERVADPGRTDEDRHQPAGGGDQVERGGSSSFREGTYGPALVGRRRALELEAERAADALLLHAPLRPENACHDVSRRVPIQAATASSGQPIDASIRVPFENAFGHNFSQVRIHNDEAAHRRAESEQAIAMTRGNHITFSDGAYRPATAAGRRLLGHELAHVVQQRGGAASAIGTQYDDDVAALSARLRVIQARLRELRHTTDRSSDEFARERSAEHERESAERIARDIRSQAIQQRGARETFPHSGVAAIIRRVATATMSGNVVTVAIPIQITYLVLSEAEAQRRATTDIQNIQAVIREIWQVDIQNGEYAGIQFRVAATVTYLVRGGARVSNAFLIEVRGQDSDPSVGEGTTGTVSLALAHLNPARVRVVAHELAHLFGFTDTYLPPARVGPDGTRTGSAAVARAENPGQADLLGLIDPEVLTRWLRRGAITPEDVARQSGPVRVWEGEASQVLRILGVLPPPPPLPSIDSEGFDPQAEIDRAQQEGEARLGQARRGWERAEESILWVEQVEEILRLQHEEQQLLHRLSEATTRP